MYCHVIVVKETSFQVGSLLGTIFPSCTFYWKTTLVSTGEKNKKKPCDQRGNGTGQKKAISSRPAWRRWPPGTPGHLTKLRPQG